jgi:ubiquinone/menaquinone biosynthesis C-methylase UbiE
MNLGNDIILNLYNLTASKIKIYSIFLEGFIIEIDGNRNLMWNLKNSAELFDKSQKVTFVKSRDNIMNYVFIAGDNLEEFMESFGKSSFDAIKYFSKLEVKPKISFKFIYLCLIAYYLIYPVMTFIILLKLLFCNIKELFFNYYHTSNINDALYEKILRNQHTAGLNFQERKNLLKKSICRIKGMNGPWLDLGCGKNSLLVEAENDNGAEIFLLDPNLDEKDVYEKYNELNKTKVIFVNGIGEKLPFEDNCFSMIYCGGVVAHVCHLNKFLEECQRVLRPGGFILFDESNECPRSKFINSLFSRKLKSKILSNHKISQNYDFTPPEEYISNPWSYWGYSTDHFWNFNLKGIVKKVSDFFSIKTRGGIGSYLCNNGTHDRNPLFYCLDLGTFTNIYIDFYNLPKWYRIFTTTIFGDLGLYTYVLCEKKVKVDFMN